MREGAEVKRDPLIAAAMLTLAWCCELQIINLAAPDLAPEGWTEEASPTQGPFTDTSVYELHIRDFSASDGTVPERLRGKYLAFGLVRRSYRSMYILCWSRALVLQPLPHHQSSLCMETGSPYMKVNNHEEMSVWCRKGQQARSICGICSRPG